MSARNEYEAAKEKVQKLWAELQQLQDNAPVALSEEYRLAFAKARRLSQWVEAIGA